MEKETRIYNNKEYHRYPQSERLSDRNYFKRGSKYLHRQIWEDRYGKIPKGYEIHHKDEDTTNNDITNLEILTNRQHKRKHELTKTEEQIQARRDFVDSIRPLTKAWHKSSAGHEWHKEHGVESWEKRETVTYICEECGKSFTTKTYHQKYCSNACKSRARRKSGIDNIKRVCPICNKEFITNKYSKQIFCSRSCANRYRAIDNKDL